jgi:hypothetical protein
MCSLIVDSRYHCSCGKTPLHYAIETVVGTKPITHLGLSLHPSIELLPACIQVLIEARADINISDRCMLFASAQFARASFSKYSCSDGATALFRLVNADLLLEAQIRLHNISLASCRSICLEILKYLVSHGADVNICCG